MRQLERPKQHETWVLFGFGEKADKILSGWKSKDGEGYGLDIIEASDAHDFGIKFDTSFYFN